MAAELGKAPESAFPARMPPLDILISCEYRKGLTNGPAASLRHRVQDELEWACLGANVNVIVPREFDEPVRRDLGPVFGVGCTPATMFRAHLLASHGEPRDLLVCFTNALPGADILGRLRNTLDRDPMFGAAAPRFSLRAGGDLLPLEPDPEQVHDRLIPRDRLHELEDLYIFPERLFPCLLIRKELLANIEPPDLSFRCLADALMDVLRRGRRCGFRTVVDNRAVVPVDNAGSAVLPEALQDYRFQPSPDEAEDAITAITCRQLRGCLLEDLLAAAKSRSHPATTGLLLDCTGMGDVHNGTSVSILGLLDGFHQQPTPGWEITVMCGSPSRELFDLQGRYPRFRVVSPADESRYAVALRLSQVWNLPTWIDLHRRALAVAVSILDTIGIDILYPITVDAYEAFQFTGEYADGLMYISEFSRQQFHHRFRVTPGVHEIVHYLSFSAGDYVASTEPPEPAGRFVFLVGNDYDHKDLPRTARMLADAFPFQSFKALGLANAPLPNVEAIPSGSLSNKVLDELYGQASCIVYPSFYEGFGLPIVKGLGYGKTVIARRSSLLNEIASRVPPHGRILDFACGPELVEALGCVLHGLPHAEVPLGSELSGAQEALSWAAIGKQLLGYARRLADDSHGDRWRKRNDALSYVRSR